MFKVGDKVKVLDDNQKGKILKISNGKITILTEWGFEEEYYPLEILHDYELKISSFKVPIEPKTKPTKPQNTSHEIKQIDLHIGQLVDSFSQLTNYEMLQIQLETVKIEIELARSERRNRLIFIHGHGSGKLKEELHKLLKSYAKLDYYDASFRKFKGGATEIQLY